MSAKLVLIARYIAILVILIAIALIVIRRKFPATYRPGIGRTRFWRELWLRWRERRLDQRERQSNLRALRGKLALVVDPDDKSARVLSWRLGVLRCRTIRSRVGSNGVARARSEKPDVIFVDALLTDISAADFYKSLDMPGTPVVFVGALNAQWGDLRSLGPSVACLAKPFDPDDAAALAGFLLKQR